MRHRFVFERISTPFLPFAGVGIVAAFQWFWIQIVWVFNIGTAVGADVPKLAVAADADLVFFDMPILRKLGVFNHVLQAYFADMPEMMRHARAVFDIAVRVNTDFPVEAGVVVLGLGEGFGINTER